MNFELSDGTIRLGIFLSLLAIFVLWESLSPRRGRALPRQTRWLTNFSMTIINTVVISVMGPVTAIVAAGYASAHGWGLFNLTALPTWLEIAAAIIILDFAIYVQHVATHKIPLLWRLHKVHHSDRDIDTSTALRFHPVEIALSMLYKIGLVFVIGPAVLAVLIFEILLNGCAMFNHSNLNLPVKLDRWLRVFMVTPDMHRVHHSVRVPETNSNYGFSLSLWDRLFQTYTPQPRDGHQNMSIGLSEYQSKNPGFLFWSLLLPFKDKVE